MSWFSSFDTGDALNKLSNISNKVQASVSELSTLVPDLPDNDQTNFLRKLALNSPDMVAERSRLDVEERRKELVRDHLSELLPWETHNEELGIFIEDCQEGILALSRERYTFLVPFAPPKGMYLFSADDGSGSTDDVENNQYEVTEAVREEVMQKLVKLQPLPTLLEDFDIDAHVGLIERLLAEDSTLSEVHSTLTGAGEKEKLFWKNYFFHCAYTRYEKGLTIEEIWERKPAPPTTEEMAASASSTNATNVESPSSVGGDSQSVELTFESDDDAGTDGSSLDASSLPPLAAGTTATSSSNSNIAGLSTILPSTNQSGLSKTTSPPASVASYEIVDVLGKEDNFGGLENDDSDDLDDLEAEIARELEED